MSADLEGNACGRCGSRAYVCLTAGSGRHPPRSIFCLSCSPAAAFWPVPFAEMSFKMECPF